MKAKRNNLVGPQIRLQHKKPGKITQTILVLASMLIGLFAATLQFASQSKIKIHAPWDIIKWAIQYPQQTRYSIALGILTTSFLMILIAIRQTFKFNAGKSNEFIHGSARWADKKDIALAGLFSDEGVYIGAWRDSNNRIKYLRHNGAEHILCYAPTRSGKGVGLVVPTLLSWKHSAVILDLKGELWELTAGWRKEHAGNKVLRFEPANPASSIGFNPLDEIRIGTANEVGDVQNLAMLLVDPDGKGLDNHWQKTAQALLVGVILHLLYESKNTGDTATLPALDAMLSNPARPINDLWKEMTISSHPVIAAAGKDMQDRPEDEAGSVLSTAKTCLSLYRDPIVAKNVTKSEFRIADLMNFTDPVSLYIITKPNDKARLRPLVRILINMILRLSTDKLEFENGLPVPQYKHRLLMMLDEFPSLGKLEIMQESLAFIAGYGIKCYIIAQDIKQLHGSYGRDESITSNCHIQAAFPPNHLETAEHLSKLTGQTTIIKKQITSSGRRMNPILSQVSSSLQEVQRPLLTPDECIRMPGAVKDVNGLITRPGDMIIYCAGYPAIYGKQPLYFQDLVFQKRAAIPAPKVTDKLIRLLKIPARQVKL